MSLLGSTFQIVVVYSPSRVWLFCGLQASLSMGFFRQEYWKELPFPSPGDFSDLGIEPMSPWIAGRVVFTFLVFSILTTEPPRKPTFQINGAEILNNDTIFCILVDDFFPLDLLSQEPDKI